MNDFKYEIGQNLKDEKKDFIIIDRKYEKDKNGHNIKLYRYKCNKCGYDKGWTRESCLSKNNRGCPCCCKSPRLVEKGINDIATTHPYLVKYFVNIEDTYKYTYSSNKNVLMKCPNCGYEKINNINNLYYKGFSCPMCSDGIFMPEKIMFRVLEQLKQNKQLDNFVYQYSKTNADWCGKYRYDFYFEKDGQSYIIETHGEQHYKETSQFKQTLEEIKENDEIKKELALKNGIKENNYIIIDCRKSDFEFIKYNIELSNLLCIFNIKYIDWKKVENNIEKSLVKEICDYWNLHKNVNKECLSTRDLALLFNINRTTIIKYLKIGNKNKWCYYNPKEEMSNNSRNLGRLTGKKIEVFKDGKSLGIFNSGRELDRKSEEIFGVKLKYASISLVCLNKQKSYKGFIFKYI